MRTTTLQLKHSNESCVLPASLLLIPLAFACFALSPQARATCQDACLTNNNTVQGDDALISLTAGDDNTAIGFNALKNTTTGQANTANGSQTLVNNTTGSGNTATGWEALMANTTGLTNTANGVSALENNTEGSDNTAVGDLAAFQNTIGNRNTVNGYEAFFSNTTGTSNTANGAVALASNTIGNFNTAVGDSALSLNTTGNNNTAVGFEALLKDSTGSFNIAVGNGAGGNLTTGINNIDIGNNGVAGDSKTIRIGRQGLQTSTFIAAISGATVPTGVAVIIDATGRLGTTTSSARFKEAIKPMDKTSEAILALKPVTFRYKHELDPDSIPQFGLVAEEVEKVNPDLVARDEQGKPYTVRYEAVNAMLLNEFLKEHRKVQEQEATVSRLESTVARQQKDFQATVAELRSALKAQAAQLRQASTQVEMSKPVLQTIANNQ